MSGNKMQLRRPWQEQNHHSPFILFVKRGEGNSALQWIRASVPRSYLTLLGGCLSQPPPPPPSRSSKKILRAPSWFISWQLWTMSQIILRLFFSGLRKCMLWTTPFVRSAYWVGSTSVDPTHFCFSFEISLKKYWFFWTHSNFLIMSVWN